MFVSLGSIIGSGWLLGALPAAQHAGPASVLSWFLAAFMLSLLALTYAELGATYPVPGEFLLMRQSAFGITRDNASASDRVSTPPVWLPDV